jgi:galactokinase
MVIFGTLAFETAVTSFAPFFAIPCPIDSTTSIKVKKDLADEFIANHRNSTKGFSAQRCHFLEIHTWCSYVDPIIKPVIF